MNIVCVCVCVCVCVVPDSVLFSLPSDSTLYRTIMSLSVVYAIGNIVLSVSAIPFNNATGANLWDTSNMYMYMYSQWRVQCSVHVIYKLDSTKVQTLGAISENIMRQDTAPQLARTRAHAVYTCQQSQFLADWQHQQVNRTAHPLFPVALGS